MEEAGLFCRTLSDVEKSWSLLEKAEHEREGALTEALLRLEQLQQLAQKFERKASLRECYLDDTLRLIGRQDMRSLLSLEESQAAGRRLEALCADVWAREPRFSALREMALTIEREGYHSRERVIKREKDITVKRGSNRGKEEREERERERGPDHRERRISQQRESYKEVKEREERERGRRERERGLTSREKDPQEKDTTVKRELYRGKERGRERREREGYHCKERIKQREKDITVKRGSNRGKEREGRRGRERKRERGERERSPDHQERGISQQRESYTEVKKKRGREREREARGRRERERREGGERERALTIEREGYHSKEREEQNISRRWTDLQQQLQEQRGMLGNVVQTLSVLRDMELVSHELKLLQAQAAASDLGKQLTEVEALLQKQDLLEAQVSAQGEALSSIRSTALKGKGKDTQQVHSRLSALEAQYKSLESLSRSRRRDLESQLRLCEFLRDCDELEQWLFERLVRLQTTGLGRELSQIQQALHKHKVLEAELQAQEAVFRGVVSRGQDLVSKQNRDQQKTVQKWIRSLQKQWTHLNSESKAKRDRLEAASVVKQYFSEAVEAFTSLRPWRRRLGCFNTFTLSVSGVSDAVLLRGRGGVVLARRQEAPLTAEDHGKDEQSSAALLQRHLKLEKEMTAFGSEIVRLSEQAKAAARLSLITESRKRTCDVREHYVNDIGAAADQTSAAQRLFCRRGEGPRAVTSSPRAGSGRSPVSPAPRAENKAKVRFRYSRGEFSWDRNEVVTVVREEPDGDRVTARDARGNQQLIPKTYLTLLTPQTSTVDSPESSASPSGVSESPRTSSSSKPRRSRSMRRSTTEIHMSWSPDPQYERGSVEKTQRELEEEHQNLLNVCKVRPERKDQREKTRERRPEREDQREKTRERRELEQREEVWRRPRESWRRSIRTFSTCKNQREKNQRELEEEHQNLLNVCKVRPERKTRERRPERRSWSRERKCGEDPERAGEEHQNLLNVCKTRENRTREKDQREKTRERRPERGESWSRERKCGEDPERQRAGAEREEPERAGGRAPESAQWREKRNEEREKRKRKKDKEEKGGRERREKERERERREMIRERKEEGEKREEVREKEEKGKRRKEKEENGGREKERGKRERKKRKEEKRERRNERERKKEEGEERLREQERQKERGERENNKRQRKRERAGAERGERGEPDFHYERGSVEKAQRELEEEQQLISLRQSQQPSSFASSSGNVKVHVTRAQRRHQKLVYMNIQATETGFFVSSVQAPVSGGVSASPSLLQQLRRV
ncbi:hypothetical protein WMY93_033750 [Mugilogobius chulae]|uniref:Uncharacterized protein n=1 Tax=Mugilogobius chulae TaxID=88201 RepID=A0AAW0MK66_9GOBI